VKKVRKSISSDFKNHLHTSLNVMNASSVNGRWKEFYKFKNSLCPKRKFIPPSSVKYDNKQHTTMKEVAGAFTCHFASLLDGTIADPISACMSHHRPSSPANLCIAPDVQKCTELIHDSNPLSAAGLDKLQYLVYRKLPFLFQHLTCIYSHTVNGDIPFQWYISLLHALYKGKGPIDSTNSYRDILLADVSGKILKKHIREQCAPFLHTYMLDTMCGGFQKRGTDFCSHYIRNLHSCIRNRRLSCGIVFVDITTAFASAIRCMIFDSDRSDQRIAHLFKRLDLPPEIFHDFSNIIRDCHALQQADVP
jgi:hypothetical protein